MKLGRMQVTNFGAYKYLEFDFTSQGLCLVSGPTKAGKSTLMDAACWILYGVTSKDSAADDMRSWFAEGDATVGRLSVQLPDTEITVERTRGKATENDLCWYEYASERPHRGKDLKDTQRLLEERLGVTAELYIIGSYMHQFSNADTFFIAKAKDRREVLEKLADLSLPIGLAARASDRRKQEKKSLEELRLRHAKLEGMIAQNESAIITAAGEHDSYEERRTRRVEELEAKSLDFENIRRANVADMVSKVEALAQMTVPPEQIDSRFQQLKTQLKALEQAKKEHLNIVKELAEAGAKATMAESSRNEILTLLEAGTCPTCSAPTAHSQHLDAAYAQAEDEALSSANHRDAVAARAGVLQEAVSVEKKLLAAYDKIRADQTSNDRMLRDSDELRAKLIAAKSETNRYAEQATAVRAEVNPHAAQVDRLTAALEQMDADMAAATQDIQDSEHLIASLNWLYDKSFELRASMLERAKNEIADKTNAYLERFFDAELRISLTFEGADKLNVDILNEGYPCPYKQLSGGERCMLKLAFNLALMKRAEDVAGVKFGTVMLDEALNGLDASLKAKAFNLLQSLDNDTVLLIDHFEEFKNLFANQFHVVKENGYSTIAAQ